MKLGITYKLEEHGWAIVYFTDGNKTIDSPVSYLHDSLSELAQMALSVQSGIPESKVVFMDEPGELQFIVTLLNGVAKYEARWYNDWASWNMHPEFDYETLLSGECRPERIVQQITTILWDIHENIGPEQYKELWVEHDFPVKQFKELTNT